jgi:aminoglycoside phosphotransferase (APT) family kinase protein
VTAAPWRSERELSAAIVAEVVAAQFPELAPVHARYLHEGWDNEAFLVNEAWIFRFPKRRDVEGDFVRETALLPALAPRLPLAIPEPRFIGAPGPRFPFRFAGYRRIDGTPAEEADPRAVDAAAAAAALGAFLAALHAFPLEEARALGVPEDEGADLTARRNQARAWAPIARRAGTRALVERGAAFLEWPPAAYAGPPRLVHNDVGPDHVLLDARGAPRGVIDWGDARLGDPATDFAGIWRWLGRPGVTAALSRYPGTDAGLLERARYRTAHLAFEILVQGAEFGRKDYVREGRRMLELALA